MIKKWQILVGNNFEFYQQKYCFQVVIILILKCLLTIRRDFVFPCGQSFGVVLYNCGLVGLIANDSYGFCLGCSRFSSRFNSELRL